MSLPIMSDFSEVFDSLSRFSPIVSILGSARVAPNHPLYKITQEMSQLLALKGYTIMTGAGTGLMQAANEGAARENAPSIGLIVDDPFVGGPNPFLDHLFCLDRVDLRKQAFMACSEALICLPGGLGTLDELSGFLLINQWHPEKKRPVFLVDSAFWSPIVDWLKASLLDSQFICADDLSCLHVTDSIETLLDLLDQKVSSATSSSAKR